MTVEVGFDKEINLYYVIAKENGKEVNLEILTKREMETTTLGELYRLMEMDL